MKYTGDEWNDVNKYYSNTFVYLPYVDKDNFIYVEGVDKSFIYFSLTNGEKGGVAFEDGPFEFDFHMPSKQYFQDDNTCVLHLARYPARQWKKGIQAENSKLSALMSSGLVDVKLTIERLQPLIHPKYYSLSDLDTKESVVLNERMAANRSFIYIDGVRVAKLNWDKKIIMIIDMFKKEILPLVSEDFKVMYV